MKHENIWRFIRDSLNQNLSVGLLIVAENTSGSPGRQGFKMAINIKGHYEGSIGGGIMEFKLLEKVKKYLHEEKICSECIPQVHRKTNSVWQSGLICSGMQYILLYTILPIDYKKYFNHADFFRVNNFYVNANERGLRFEKKSENLSIGHKSIKFFHQECKKWTYQELLQPEMTIYIVGGGHVGAALSRVLRSLDSDITIFDHRKEILSLYPQKHYDRMIIGPYENISKYINGGENSYAAVVSTSFTTDELGIKQLLGKNLKYLGVMGSQAKLSQIKQNLKEAGYSKQLIDTLRTPIGLKINSRSAEEIAISIAAEMIKIKNQNC